MADEQGVEETITAHQKSAIDEYDLDLSLGLRPSLNSSSSSSSRYPKNLPECNGHQIMSKRDQQAIRRHEAKVKRDLKRKASYSFSAFPNGVVIQEEGDEDGVSERRRKGMSKVGFQPPYLWGNAGVFRQGQNCKMDRIMNEGGENGEFRSSGSSGSSSGISDNNNNYHSNNSAAGGNSSDTSSHSSHSHLHASDATAANNVPTVNSTAKSPVSSRQQTHTNCSNHNLLQPQLGSSSPNQRDSFPNSSLHSKSPEHVTSAHTIPQATEMCTSDKECTPKPRSPSPKEAKVVLGKPPKPNNGQMSQQSAVLPQMPCVSATGNGPNGKTITGFLYKYTKTEVSIICVCHGASFSPASFVEHAGGVDVEHPLKHIRVVPFAVS